MKQTSTQLKKELRKYTSPKRKSANEWFFKTHKGDYGYGDRFIGVSMPNIRNIAKQSKDVSLDEIKKLISSKIHEERMLAIVLLVNQFKESQKNPVNKTQGKKIYDFYLKNTKHINNWDLVDVSASYIVGAYLLTKPNNERKILYKLARSHDLWEQRISIIATFAFIYQNNFTDTYEIADMLMLHKHDLIHKAVGWMLREAGKRDLKAEEKYLLGKRNLPNSNPEATARYKLMPRTMLRYAIEKFPKPKYKAFIKGIL